MWIDVSREVAAPPERVWRLLTAWERQPEWMLDARDVEVLTPLREGVGVMIRCPTNLLGVTVQDMMRVTVWQEPRYLEVVHLGRVITGSGAFELSPVEGGTVLRWWEEIRPPLGRIGAVGARYVAAPVIRRIFGRSLDRFAVLCEASV